MSKKIKKTVSILLSIIMVFSVFAIVPFTASATNDPVYVKVTDEPEDWSGDYLIVYENGSKAFNGGSDLNSAGNCIDVTISGGEIASGNAANAAKVTIAKIDGGYSIKTAGGTYIGGQSGTNKIVTDSDAILNTISLDDDDYAQIVSNTAYFRYNTTWGGFRYYKSVQQQPVCLYKYTEPEEPEPEPAVGTIYDSGEHDASELNTGDYIVSGIGSIYDQNSEYTITLKAGTYTDWPGGDSAYDEDYTIEEAGLFEISTDAGNVLCFSDWMEDDYMPFVDGAIANAFYVESADHDAKTITLAGANLPTEPEPEPITLNFTDDSQFNEWYDYCHGYGYWYIGAGDDDDDYGVAFVGLSDQASGTYTLADLDTESSYVFIEATNTVVSLTDASLTVTVDGPTVTVSGTVTGNDGNTYAVTITAPASYTVVWMNGDEEIETDYDVPYDVTPTYDGETPTKAEDDNYTYTFSGWTDGENTYGLTDALPAVTADVTYTATFEATPKAPATTYKVTWNDWDGTELGYSEVAEGDAPLNPYEGLAKDDDVLYTYTFTGWTDENGTFYATDAELPAVTADITYTATFEAEPKTVEIIDGKCYIDGILAKGAGLVPYEGDYYYVKANGTIYKDASLCISEDKTNGLLPAGKYAFDEDGKMIIYNGIVNGCYYVDGAAVKGAGLIEIDGDYYYVKANGTIYKDSTLVITEEKANGLAPAGLYTFDADGKMVYKDGVVDGYYYVNNVLTKGVGLVEHDGDIYFVKQNGAIYKNSTLVVTEAKTNGLAPKGIHAFDADGKMVN